MSIDKEGYWLDCDFLTGACDSYENGKKHFNYSDIASEKGDYGFAISHLILGAEEMIKAMILVCLHGDRNFIDTKEKERIFRNHNFKHINIKDFFHSLTPGSQDDFEQNILKYTCYPDECKNKYQSTAIFLSKCLKLGLIGDNEINELINLLNAANDFKNRGFYVDYDFNWKNPNDISKETFDKYHNLTEKLSGFIAPIFILPLTDERIMDFLFD